MKNKILKTSCLIFSLIIALSGTSYIASAAYAKEAEKERIEQRIDEILKSMTLDEKIAQMLFVYMPKDAKGVQQKQQYGGYVLFARDFKKSNKEKINKKIKGIQKVSKINMLMAVDEEGGTVVRASKYKQFRKSPYKSPKKVYQSGGWSAVEKDAKSKSKFLISLGLNTNFAPVADVAYKKSNFIYSRSFSTNAKSVSKFINITVKEMKNQNCVATLKHFPGYGNNGDTHSKLIVDKRSKKTFQTRDLKPFEKGIDSGASMIMISHNIVYCFDKKNTASLSKNVHDYLRKDMGFKGVIITDGLDMEGVKKKYKSNEAIAVKAVKSGNDMLCTPYGKISLKAIKKAVKSGEIKKSRIDSSVRRILRLKLKYKIIK
ncbi:MAG: beta-hexosaminidase [Eubacterium sp.]|nr:beta-hexosaminidase [Eubacterium sp.]